MVSENRNEEPSRGSRFAGNWVGLIGVVLAGFGLFSALSLISFDFLRGFKQPYLGILTYLILPGFIWVGLILVAIGAWIEHKKRHKREVSRFPIIDLNKPSQKRKLLVIVIGGFFFFLLSALGSYQAYLKTESVGFCGMLCHTVMEPEYTTYLSSPHARVGCTECHIGSGASWFVRSKVSGMYQIYAVLTNSFDRPIPVPVENLRPARGTCEQCHWPEKFFGAVDFFQQHFLLDEENTPWAIRMLLKVGGANPAHGPVGGIHWHMVIANRIEYLPANRSRQEIPWVRITNLETGNTTLFQSKDNPLTPGGNDQQVRVLDCIDCHNRPTHIFASPESGINNALWLGRIDRSIPSIREKAGTALLENADSASLAQGMAGIAQSISQEYADYANQQKIRDAISQAQDIYRRNFFPDMKTSWKVRPNNVGHRTWPGCFRCHDGNHLSKSGNKIATDCDTCHLIVAQGQETQENVCLTGIKFEHPGGPIPPQTLCNVCHTGAP